MKSTRKACEEARRLRFLLTQTLRPAFSHQALWVECCVLKHNGFSQLLRQVPAKEWLRIPPYPSASTPMLARHSLADASPPCNGQRV